MTITGSDGTWTSLICKGQPGYVFSQYVAPGALQTTSGGTAAPKTGDADMGIYAVLLGVSVLALAGGGFFLWRRKRSE